MGQVKSKVKPLNLRKGNFEVFKGIVNGISGETALRDKGVEQSWKISEKVFITRAGNPLEQEIGKKGKRRNE